MIRLSVFGGASLFYLVIASSQLLALDPNKAITQYNHKMWQASEGLPHTSVQTIVQTPDGYIWFGTQGGLVRFDGVRFVVFNKGNTEWLKENVSETLLLGRDGTFWIGTSGAGICRIKDGQPICYGTTEGLSQEYVRALAEGRDGRLWVGTGGGGLNYFKDGVFTSLGKKPLTILALCEDREGNLWIGTHGDGIKKLTPQNDESFYTTTEGLSDNVVYSIFEDHEGSLWFGTLSGLSRYKNGQFTNYTTAEGLPKGGVRVVYEDSQQNLWIGTTAGGLGRFKNGKFNFFLTKDGLSDDTVLSIYEDREENLWVGTKGGLDRFKDGKFTPFGAKEGLPSDELMSLCEGQDGSLWIASHYSGLAHLKDGSVTTYTTASGLPTNNFRSIFNSRDGSIWAAAEYGTKTGLVRWKDGVVTSYSMRDGLLTTEVSFILEDDESLIIGHSRGKISRFKNNRYIPYADITGPHETYLYTAANGPDGSLWVGSNEGLAKIKEGRVERYTVQDGLPSREVLSVFDDHQGSVWLATRGGLCRFKNGKFTTYTTANGLYEDVIFDVIGDDLGNLWLTSIKGIFRLSKSELNDFADGKISVIHSNSYNTEDGLRRAECIKESQSTAMKARDGKLWFVTTKGLVMIDPNDIRVNKNVPPLLIEQVMVDNEAVMPGKQSPELPPGKEKVDFYYTGLSLVSPERVSFKYKLEGFDADWVEAGTRRVAYYTRIPPGPYTFKVIACNEDGVCNLTGSSFAFSIRPHFYQTRFFYLLCVAVAGLMIWVVHLFQVRRVKAGFSVVLAERNRMARELHDTLEQGLAGIVMQLDLASAKLEAAPASARNYLELARTMASYSKAEARRTIWDLRSSLLEGQDVTTALSEVSQQLNSGTEVQTEINVTGLKRPLPAAVESNLLRIGQEAITNAFKHSGAQRVLIDLHYGVHEVTLSVRDDGHGFETGRVAHAHQGHFGLLGMRERADKLGGELIISSEIGAGSQIVISLPIDA